MLLTEEDEEGLESGDEGVVVVTGVEQTITPEVFLNFVVGLSSPKTLRLKGLVSGEEVIVMIDPGATHNFISLSLIEKLQLPLVQTKEFGVSLGNGESVKGSGECRGVLVQFEEVEVVEDFLPFILGNSDVLLGLQWLEKLGTVTTNWKSQRMSFKVGRRTIVLQGDPTLTHARISLKAMIWTVRKGGSGLL